MRKGHEKYKHHYYCYPCWCCYYTMFTTVRDKSFTITAGLGVSWILSSMCGFVVKCGGGYDIVVDTARHFVFRSD